jgi:hypothetical protein
MSTTRRRGRDLGAAPRPATRVMAFYRAACNDIKKLSCGNHWRGGTRNETGRNTLWASGDRYPQVHNSLAWLNIEEQWKFLHALWVFELLCLTWPYTSSHWSASLAAAPLGSSCRWGTHKCINTVKHMHVPCSALCKAVLAGARTLPVGSSIPTYKGCAKAIQQHAWQDLVTYHGGCSRRHTNGDGNVRLELDEGRED